MPINKSADIRYRIIDGCLTNPLKKYPTMKDLVEKVSEQVGDISKDMIAKDIAAMRKEHNAPISFDYYQKGYYYTEEGFSLKKFPITYDEVSALDFATAMLGKLKGSSLYENFESAINKIIMGLRIGNIINISEKLILQPEEAIETIGNKWIQVLLNAIVEKNCVEIVYQSYQRDKKVHIISPYMLKEYQKRWYLFGYSTKHQKVLTLGLDRMVDIKMSEEKYYRDETFSEEEYFKHCIGIMKEDEPEKVVLEFNEFQRVYVESQPLHKSQKIKNNSNGKLVIELEVYISHELVRLILSYGEAVRVLEPERLRKQIIETIKSTIKNY